MSHGYWFEPASGALGYGDGRKPGVGVTHTVDCKPVLCEAGLHYSEHPLDALQYAESNILWLVVPGGEIARGNDKCAATERTYIKRVDVTNTLRIFARKVALENIEKARPYFTDEGWECCIDYLSTGDERRRESARSAAWEAESAARSAAWAAESAAWAAAAWAAAWAAESAAWAAESAAWAAAWAESAWAESAESAESAAAQEKYSAMFKQMIDEAMEAAQ